MESTKPSYYATTLEQPLKQRLNKKSLFIGVPKEIHLQEKRVPLTPGAVGVLIANGHSVIVEHNAGANAGFTDKDYSENGAVIAYTAQEVYAKSNVIVKISPLEADEIEQLHEKQIIISAVHLGAIKPYYLKSLIDKNITAFGFEFIQASDGSIPFMRMMSQIAGITSIHIASELLSGHNRGKGLLLGGISGVPPAIVTIIGAGSVGYYAVKTALGLGAAVKVIDSDVARLQRLEEMIGTKLYTAVSQQDYLTEAVTSADVIIGAAYTKGTRAPVVVTEQMVYEMREGSVIIDVSIDQGGCVETSQVTTHDKPTYEKHGVIHYCVPNIPSRVPQTASVAISNILGPMLIKIGEAGSIQNLIASDMQFKTGLYVYHKHITQRSLASMFNMNFMDIDLLYAAQL